MKLIQLQNKNITLTVFIRFRFYWPLTAKKCWFYADGMSLNFSQRIFNSCNHHTKDQDQDEHINIIIINHVTTSFFSSRKQILPKIAQNTNLTLNSLCFCWYFLVRDSLVYLPIFLQILFDGSKIRDALNEQPQSLDWASV